MSEGLQYINVNELALDSSNPRLPESIERSESSMLNHIALTTSIEDLMNAIVENGFFPGEPLIAVKEGGKYVVVEGNRRLTAVRLIFNPHDCETPSARMLEIANHARAINRLASLQELPVIVRETREEILPYLGFRHITGIKQWEPLAKARYIEQLFDSTPIGAEASERYQQVARAIGSRKDHIKRSLDALAVYKVMERNDFYGIDGLDEESIKFSVLSTALADEKIGGFVGLSTKDDYGDSESNDVIINNELISKDNVKELTSWLYKKDEKGKTRVGESRNLRQLSAVIDNDRALTTFRHGADLKVAYQLTANLQQDFMELLYRAESALTEAAGVVATMDYDAEALNVAKRIQQNIKLIGTTIKDKKASEDDDF